jgi:Spy/CpxP family protein refolding chaperone
MVRTQIQLTEAQHAQLKQLAARENKSVAELIRQSVEALVSSAGVMDKAERRARALAAIGRFRGGEHDLAENHDRYLSEAYGP